MRLRGHPPCPRDIGAARPAANAARACIVSLSLDPVAAAGRAGSCDAARRLQPARPVGFPARPLRPALNRNGVVNRFLKVLLQFYGGNRGFLCLSLHGCSASLYLGLRRFGLRKRAMNSGSVHMNLSSTRTEAAAEPPSPGDCQNAGAARTASIPTQIISFAIDNDQYGVDIMAVREIKGWSEITHLPRQPESVRGVLNLRGAIVPIIDLRCRFGQGLTDASPVHVVIIVQVGTRQVGLLADRVLDIVSFDAAQIQPVPKIAQASRIDFLSGLVTVDTSMIALIDLYNLLSLPVGEPERPQAN
jgi:purine-binding chemotaxis protein CheW